jgi:hypothetical protein
MIFNRDFSVWTLNLPQPLMQNGYVFFKGFKDDVWWSSNFGQFDRFGGCRLMLESNG